MLVLKILLHNRNLAEEFGAHDKDSFLNIFCQNLSSKNISGGMFCINNLLLPFCSLFTS